MGWNANCLILQGTTEDLLRLLAEECSLAPIGAPVTIQQATSVRIKEVVASPILNDGWIAIAELDGFVVAWDPEDALTPLDVILFSDQAKQAVAGRKIVHAMFDAENNIYGFVLYQGTSRTRDVAYDMGSAMVDAGEPLAKESEVCTPNVYDEDWVLSMIWMATGVTLEMLQDATYQPHAMEPLKQRNR